MNNLHYRSLATLKPDLFHFRLQSVCADDGCRLLLVYSEILQLLRNSAFGIGDNRITASLMPYSEEYIMMLALCSAIQNKSLLNVIEMSSRRIENISSAAQWLSQNIRITFHCFYEAKCMEKIYLYILHMHSIHVLFKTQPRIYLIAAR